MKQGNYMVDLEVIDYVETRLGRFTLSSIIHKICKLHKAGDTSYYSTEDLKNVMMPELFREMECHVTTHMVCKEQENTHNQIA